MKRNDASSLKIKPERPFVIGFTGGIGSGKSTLLSEIEKSYDVRVISADEVGRELMAKGRAVYRALVSSYGDSILLPDGEIDRKVLSALAFSDEESQKRINAIEHPIIKTSILRRISHLKCRAVLLEAALLQEGGLVPVCDFVISVTADQKTRVARLMAGRAYSAEKCASIMDRQMKDEDFRAFSDAVIDNSGSLRESMRQLAPVLEKLGVRRRENAR